MQTETIRALTPIFIAAIGGVIGLTVLFVSGPDNAKLTAGLGLAGTAIAGAAGLAQPPKNESDSPVQEDSQKIKGQEI